MLSTSFTMSGTLPKVPERKKHLGKLYAKPKYLDFGSQTMHIEKETPNCLLINDYIDDYKDKFLGIQLNTSLHSKSKDLQPRIILQSPMLTSTPSDRGRANLYTPSDTAISWGYFDPNKPQFPTLNSYRGKADAIHMGQSNRNFKNENRHLSQNKSQISRIQSRPLPSPTSSLSSKTENVYLSPIK